MHRNHLTILSASLLLATATIAAAEAPTVIYEAEIVGYTIPHARDVAVDDVGDAYLIGSAYEDGVHLDVLVAKFDPLGNLLWTRYITGSGHNYATGIALDTANDVWVTGWTDSPDFPVVNPMDDTLTGFRDVFLMKLDRDDGSIRYSTFLGGDYTDSAQGIALNAAGEIYLTGRTGSTDFPTTPDAYQPEPSFPLYFFSDAFVTKLSPTGEEILYSTYFGGTQDDEAVDIALDPAGNIVIAGKSAAADFPLANELQSQHNDIFISMLSADGSTLLFSTFFGGEDHDRLWAMTMDGSGMLHLVGSTRSVGFPTTPGAYQEDFVGGINACEVPFGEDYNCEDIFVTKLDLNGGGLVWSTYLGGSRVEDGKEIAVDAQGHVYLAGYTGSSDFPPDGVHFGAEIIVCRLSADGSILDNTYSIDSGSANRGNGIAVDEGGDIYFTGTVGVPASIYISKLQGERTTAVDGVAVGPKALALGPNLPNPFNPTTNITYTIPEGGAASVRLSVYDAGGRLVRTLVDGFQAGGSRSVTWRGWDERGAEVTSGVYFYRLDVNGHSLARRMVLIR